MAARRMFGPDGIKPYQPHSAARRAKMSASMKAYWLRRRAAATYPLQLCDGDDPALGYCRVCGVFARPPFEGYYDHGVCSRECFDEWKWRTTLRTLRKRYRPRPTDAPDED